MMQITFDNVHGNYDIFMDCLQAIIGEKRNSFIDLGCNKATVTGLLTDFKERRYIDILQRELDYPYEQKYFDQYNVFAIPMLLSLIEKYSVSFSLDMIEHLYFEDGLRLLKMMCIISNKQILFTPDTAWMMDYIGTDPEGHHSLWTPTIIEELYPNKYAFIHFKEYHQALSIGAFFFFSCENIKQEFNRVVNELKTKSWANNLLVL